MEHHQKALERIRVTIISNIIGKAQLLTSNLPGNSERTARSSVAGLIPNGSPKTQWAIGEYFLALINQCFDSSPQFIQEQIISRRRRRSPRCLLLTCRSSLQMSGGTLPALPVQTRLSRWAFVRLASMFSWIACL